MMTARMMYGGHSFVVVDLNFFRLWKVLAAIEVAHNDMIFMLVEITCDILR